MAIIRRALLLLCAVVCTIGLIGTARSEETNDAAKRQAFERFVQLTDMQRTYNQMLDIMSNQMKLSFQAQIQQTVQKAANRTALDQALFTTTMEKFVREYVTRLKSAINEVMPFAELLTKVYYPVYDKYFSESELRSLANFYESPLGRKLIIATPSILQETVTKTNELYMSKILRISSLIAEEEFRKIEPELEILKNK